MNKLIDRFGREHNYLRVSVTDRCNLRCAYCMPPEGIELKPQSQILTFEEIETLARLFVSLGVTKIRVTGGEPLVRKGAVDLCRRIAAIPGLETLALSTNGLLLPKHAATLKDAGVRQINISLDTLQHERFRRITQRDDFDDVLRGIAAARSAGFRPLKLNTVVIRGFNDDELPDFIRFADEHELCVRFIEYMPFPGNNWREHDTVPYSEMRSAIEAAYTLVPLRPVESGETAKNFRVDGTRATVGFITTMTEHFCSTCSRLRLTADGRLRNCLFGSGELDLKSLLRSGASVATLHHAIVTSLHTKWDRHPSATELVAKQSRAMVAIGG